MGAYLRGEKLEFNKRKYNLKRTGACNVHKFEENESLDTRTYGLLYSETIQLKYIVKEMFVCSDITYSDVQEIKNFDISKIGFTFLGVYVNVSTSTGSSLFLISDKTHPNIISFEKSNDNDNIYLTFTKNPNSRIEHDSKTYVVSRLNAIVGYFTYDSKYIVFKSSDSKSKVVFNNDVMASDSTYASSPEILVTIAKPITYENSQPYEENISIESGSRLKSNIKDTDVYFFNCIFGRADNTTSINLNGNTSFADKLMLNYNISTEEITHVI